MKNILLFVLVVALCMALASAKTFENENVEIRGNPKCSLCKFVVSEVQKELANHPVDPKKITDKVCRIFPGKIQDTCETLFTGIILQIIELLKDGQTVDKVCELVKLCDKTAFLGKLSAEDATKLYLSLNTNFNSNGTCAMCKMIIQKAEDLIHDNEDEVERKLLAVCKLLPDKSLEQMCDTIVVLYGPQIINYILTHADPEKICTQIGLCKESKIELPVVVVPAELEEASNGGCALCTYVLGVVEDYIKDDATQQKIQEALDNVCKLLPGGFKDQCSALVRTYEPQLIEYILAKYPPKQICTLIGVCDALKVEEVVVVEVPVEESSGGCALCTYVIGVVQDYIKDDTNQQKIQDALNNVCNLLPGTFKAQCLVFVKTYEPQLIEFLLAKYPPKQICTLIGVCDAATAEAQAASCPLCTYVVGLAEDFIRSEPTQKKIQEALDKVCDLLPGNVKGSCRVLVETYEPQLIEFLLQKYPPKAICALIGVCEAKQPVSPRKRIELVKNDSTCGICKLVVGYVEQFIADQKNEKQIEQLVEKICAFLPGGFAQQCNALVEAYLPQIINLLVNRYPAEKVCQYLTLCDNKANDVFERLNAVAA